MKAGRLLVLIVVPVLCFAVFLAGYAVWHQHELVERQRRELVERQQRLVVETSARLREILIKDQGLTEQVLQSSAAVTYDEFFRQCDRSIDERDRLVVEVRLLPQDVLIPLRDEIVSQMRALNELTRAKVNMVRLLVLWRSKAGNHSADFARLEAEFLQTHVGGERQAIEWAARTEINEINALARELSQSADTFDGLYDKATDEEEAVSVEARKSGVMIQPQLKEFAAANKALSASARSVAH